MVHQEEWRHHQGLGGGAQVRAALLNRNSEPCDIRKLFYPGQQPRCACVRDTGAPSTDPAAKLNRGESKEIQ